MTDRTSVRVLPSPERTLGHFAHGFSCDIKKHMPAFRNFSPWPAAKLATGQSEKISESDKNL